jgi:methanogenic corrinoid protein MtbC1
MACYDPNFMGQKFRAGRGGGRSGDSTFVSRRGLGGAQTKETSKATAARTSLELAIETEILPRLMLAHKAFPSSPSSPRAKVTPKAKAAPEFRVDRFAHLIIAEDVGEAVSFIEALIEAGAGLEDIYLDLLAPTACLLGKFWEDDTCCFTDVTLGLIRLHQILSSLSPSFLSEGGGHGHMHRAIIAPMPGDRHTFGLVMVVDFFRRAGWDVVGWPLAVGDRIEEIVRGNRFDLVGLSLSDERQLDLAKSFIAAIRRASCNRSVVVIVGGRVFNHHPEFVQQVGADGTAEHGLQAVENAENLVALSVGQ